MLSARFEDRSFALQARMLKMLRRACEQAADRLAEGYRAGLQARTAPPHSAAGQIPHAYFGWKPGGFGPVNETTTVNNIPPEFSQEQTDYLSSYIESAGSDETGGAVVGFAPSHVTRRDQNYLLEHDARERPWVRPIYGRVKKLMADEAKSAFHGGR